MASSENYANDYETTLNGAISSAVRPVNFTLADPIPSSLSGGAFRVRIDNEYLFVPAGGVSGQVCNGATTVEGSVAATHSNGAKVDQVLTRQGMLNSPGPMTTQGDITYLDSTLNPARLPLGTSAQVLTADAATGIPKWAAASGGGGGTGLPLSNPYSARVHRVAAYTAAAAAWTKFPFDTVTDDSDSDVVIASNRYVARIAGVYQIDAALTFGALLTAQTLMAIRVNGAEIDLGQNVNSGFGMAAAARVKLAVGDYVEVWYYSTNATAFNVGAASQNFMEVTLLGIFALPSGTMVARMYRAAAYTLIGTSTWTKLPLDTSSWDPDSDLTIASSRYVARVAGKYRVTGRINLGAFQNAQLAVAIYKNGTIVASGDDGNAGIGAGGVSDEVDLIVGDYIEIWYLSAAATAIGTGSAQTYASISLIAGSQASGSWGENEGYASNLLNQAALGAEHFLGVTLPAGWAQEGTAPDVAAAVKNSTLAWRNTSSKATHYVKAFVPGAATAFRLEARVLLSGLATTDGGSIGLMVKDSTTTDAALNGVLMVVEGNTNDDVALYTVAAGALTLSGAVVNLGAGCCLQNRYLYFALARDAANVWTAFVSFDRNHWIPVGGTPTNALTVAKAGFRSSSPAAGNLCVADFIDQVS